MHTKDPGIIERTEFYRIDISILSDLGFGIKTAFSYRYLPSDVNFYFIWWWTYALFPVLRGKLTGKKTLITGTFNFFRHVKGADYYSRPLYQRLLIKKSAQMADANVMVSTFEYRKMQEEVTTGNVYYSPHALQTDRYLRKVSRQRENYMFTISWMNRSNSLRKCIPEIIKAARILKDQGRSYRFIIAGSVEPDAQYLLALSASLGMQEDIQFIGPIDEENKVERLFECGIYLQPTLFEGFGVAIAEALLCEAPTITSRVGAVPEVTGDHCCYTDGKNPSDIAAKIIQVFENYDAYLDMARKGSVHVKVHFHYERRKQDIFQILKEIGILRD